MMEGVTQNPGGTAYQTAGPPATGILIAGKTGYGAERREQFASR